RIEHGGARPFGGLPPTHRTANTIIVGGASRRQERQRRAGIEISRGNRGSVDAKTAPFGGQKIQLFGKTLGAAQKTRRQERRAERKDRRFRHLVPHAGGATLVAKIAVFHLVHEQAVADFQRFGRASAVP